MAVTPNTSYATQYALINCSATGANTVVTGIAGRAIEVIRYVAVPTSAETLTWKSGTTALTGPMPCGGAGQPGRIDDRSSEDGGGVFRCLPGDSLILNLLTGVQTGGSLAYRLK